MTIWKVPAIPALGEPVRRLGGDLAPGQGFCHIALGQPREAANLFRRALAVHPHLDAVRRNLALATAEAVKRLEVARALALKPRLLLFDEPLGGLSHEEMTAAAALIRSLRAEGLTVILVEHQMRVAMSLVDRVVVLDHGALIASGPPRACGTTRASSRRISDKAVAHSTPQESLGAGAKQPEQMVLELGPSHAGRLSRRAGRVAQDQAIGLHATGDEVAERSLSKIGLLETGSCARSAVHRMSAGRTPALSKSCR